MRWEDERYVRVYTRDTTDWLCLSFIAQGLFCLLLRKVDRAGILELGRHGKKGVAVAIGHPGDWPRLSEAFEELLADGCVRIEGSTLVVPNFIEAQEAPQSDAARKRTEREKARSGVTKRDGQNVTGVTSRDETSQNVTPGHETGQKVTSGHVVSRPVTPNCAVPSVPSVEEACTELAAPASMPALVRDETPVLVELPCVGSGPKRYPVTEAQAGRWREAYPGVSVEAELRKALAWLEANPTKRKTARGVPRFLVSWLSKAQDAPRLNGTGGKPDAIRGHTGDPTQWWRTLDEKETDAFFEERKMVAPELDNAPPNIAGFPPIPAVVALIQRWSQRAKEATP